MAARTSHAPIPCGTGMGDEHPARIPREPLKSREPGLGRDIWVSPGKDPGGVALPYCIRCSEVMHTSKPTNVDDSGLRWILESGYAPTRRRPEDDLEPSELLDLHQSPEWRELTEGQPFIDSPDQRRGPAITHGEPEPTPGSDETCRWWHGHDTTDVCCLHWLDNSSFAASLREDAHAAKGVQPDA